MRAPILRYLAVIALAAAALVSSQAPAPAAAEPTASVGKAPGCVDGAKVVKVNLVAADGQDTTFTTIVRKAGDEVFRDSSRMVTAGTSEKVSIPGLTYGTYGIQVFVGGKLIFGDGVTVLCPPVGDYTNPSVSGFGGCEGETVLTFRNRPIRGAQGRLLPVKFALFDDTASGPKTVSTLTLPDNDSQPYTEWRSFPKDTYPGNARITANGTVIGFDGFAVADCVPHQPQVPNTGA